MDIVEYVERLNRRVLNSIDKTYPVGLMHGQMGICIYFYHLYRIEKNENEKVIADQLLDDILGKISRESSISVEDGLAGVALGIIHLIRSDFIEGDVNELLEDIDSRIFNRLVFFSDKMIKAEELLHLLFYFYIRFKHQNNDNDKYIYTELIIKSLDLFVMNYRNDLFDEYYTFSVYDYHLPVFVYICGKLFSLDFYNEKIMKIVKTFETLILSRLPVLHSNRLYLLTGILSIIPYMNNSDWGNYASFLCKNINLNYILENEMKNKHIFISNGISMIYLLLNYLNKNYPEYKIEYDCNVFYNRIISSEAWEAFKQDYYFEIHHGLVNGFPGVQLVLSYLYKKCV